jgi:hypothetical protein
MSVQTTIIQLLNVTANTTLVTMGTQTRLEDVTLVLTSSAHWTLKGIVFPGDTTVTSKLRTAVVSVNNSTANSTGSSTVIGVECNGTGTLSTSSFSFNCIKGSTINVYSNGAGIKRGILVSNTNIVTTRDTNIYVARPTNTTSLGSYVGVETNDPLSTGSIQLRSTTVGVVKPSAGHSYTASDILQTTPTSITDPTYLASAGIQLGPGVDLVTKSAGTKGLSTYVYPTTIYYGLRGNLRDGAAPAADAYMWPGTQAVSSLFPDTDLTTPAFYYIQQPAILSGLRVACQTGPGAGYSTTVTIRRTPVGGSIADTVFTITLNDTETTKTFYNGSVDFAVGDKVHVLIKYTGAGSTNLTHDISVQIDFF